MKKTYLARHNALFTSADLSWGFYALVGACVVLLVRMLVPNLFWQLTAPVFQSADILSNQSHAFFASFENTAKLALDNERLSTDNLALTNENKMLIQKDASLTALLGTPAAGKTASSIIAGVVARPPTSPYDTLLLSVGIQDGVLVGMEAFGAGGVPLGVVTSAFSDFSRVTLFSSYGMETQGWVGSANTPLVVKGSGGGTLIATLARAATVTEGDSVFVPGPGQRLLGRVTHIESDPSSPVVTLRITSAVNLFSVTWVILSDTHAFSSEGFLAQ